MPFFSIDLLCFLIVVLVVVASGDSLVARMVGEVFRCDLCDPCMMLSCAFILVKKKNILVCISSLFPRISGRGITSGIKAHVQTLGSLCSVAHLVGVALSKCECLGENS